MLFSSVTFLYFFLPAVLVVYNIVGKKYKNIVLLIFSCIFYAWGEPRYVFLMLSQIVIVYAFTRCVKTKHVLWAVVFPVIPLIYYKYSGMADHLPIGISFYTFQLISYVIDVYRKRVPLQKNLINLMTYVTLFPQLVAGPIVRYSEIDKELENRDNNLADFSDGIVRFCAGLGKKVLIANILGEVVGEILELSGREVWMSWIFALAVMMQIYYDFSGYSDMATGLGLMFGFHFPTNFRYPFISESISEFWRRWHITLGAWFRDYIYIPMGGSKVKRGRLVLNLMTVWLLTGIWHGAGLNFIVWGLMFGILICMEKLFPGKLFFKQEKTVFFKVLSHIYVILAVLIGFLMFNADNVALGLKDISSLFHNFYMQNADVNMLHTEQLHILKNSGILILIAILGSTPVPLNIVRKTNNMLQSDILKQAFRIAYVFVILILCTAYLIDGSFNPFLYFRF